MAQRNAHDINHYNELVNTLKGIGIKTIVILGPMPQWQPSLTRTIALRHFSDKEIKFPDTSFDKSLLQTDLIMKRKFAQTSNTIYISLIDSLCDASSCIAKVDENNTPIVWDYGHLSLPGSLFVAKNVLSKNEALKVLMK